METSDKTIKIVKILNLPAENSQTQEVEVDIDIMENKYSYRQVEPSLETAVFRIDVIRELCDSGIIKCNTPYKIKALLVEDEEKNKYTLYDFSYKYTPYFGFHYFDFCYSMILFGEHVVDLDEKQFSSIDVQAEFNKSFSYNIHYNYENQEIKNLPVCKSQNVTFQLTGNLNFEQAENTVLLLAEYIFLFYEEYLYYDTFILYTEDKQYKLVRANKRHKNRKWKLYSGEDINSEFLTDINTIHIEENTFKNFAKFRKDSEFIFDLFKTAVFSDTFMEDYPLRLSQILEGLSNFLGITKTSRGDKFIDAIKKSILKTDLKDEYFESESVFNDFCNKTKDHRHKFSHANVKGDYLESTENKEYAIILYTVIRVLIVQYIRRKLS